MLTPAMLRLTSVLSIVTWAALLVGCALALWFGSSDALFYIAGLVLGTTVIILSLTILVRNQPVFLGLMFFLSLFGLLPGLYGVAGIFWCIAMGSAATPLEWCFAVSLALMLVPPFNWATLWRDYRHDIALDI
jgi:hypothetical protein